MSQKHPVIAVTGSSGAGTTFVKRAFEHIFFREKITAIAFTALPARNSNNAQP
jgi:phosphoribulokinase